MISKHQSFFLCDLFSTDSKNGSFYILPQVCTLCNSTVEASCYNFHEGVDSMRTYTQDEKQAVIDRVISGEPSVRILADTGIPKSTFYSWLRIYREEQNAANRRTVDIRNFHLLENKVARLESIVEILKSATCTPKAPLRQRLYAASSFTENITCT